MYPQLFKEFLELKGPNYTLRCPNERHLGGLVEMLRDSEVIKNSTQKIYNDIDSVKLNYLTESYHNFKNEISICFVVEDNKTGNAVGFREVFVDPNKENVTIQGFTHPKYRNMGVSKESYVILMRYLQIFGIAGITANCDFQNFASMALLYSVGFKQVYISDTLQGMKGVYNLDLDLNSHPSENSSVNENDKLYKRIVIFCRMYLGATSLDIQPSASNFIQYRNMNYQEYDLNLTTVNWEYTGYARGAVKKMKFRSNGIAIKNINNQSISLIDGSSPYIDPWGYCWEICSY